MNERMAAQSQHRTTILRELSEAQDAYSSALARKQRAQHELAVVEGLISDAWGVLSRAKQALETDAHNLYGFKPNQH